MTKSLFVFISFFLVPFFINFASVSEGVASNPEVNILWGNFSARDTVTLIESEIAKPLGDGLKPVASTEPIPYDKNTNPFLITPEDFFVDHYLPDAGDTQGEPPAIAPQSALWFSQAITRQKMPDIFVIGGHQVISEGWHNDAETRFMFLPTLQQTLNVHPDAKRLFEHVKIAILFGCNTMTNLEPHYETPGFNYLLGSQKRPGDYLSPQEIQAVYESGPQGRLAMIGNVNKINSLEFYKERLAREYGPGTPKYEYTRFKKREVCRGPGKYDNCKITNVDRIFPESGLFDGLHRYNYPHLMKQIFPNAVLVIGFSSASPSDNVRAVILRHSLDTARLQVNNWLIAHKHAPIQNVLYPLLDEQTPLVLKKKIIQAIRANWTNDTYRLNRGRPSGSITPAIPELDAHGVFEAQVPNAPLYSPYEERAENGLAHGVPVLKN